MKTHAYGLLLAGAAHVCGCANASLEPVTKANEPLLAAKPSMRTDVVAVQAARGIEEQLCTGTLLLPNLVLTARHCLIADRSAINDGDCATAVVPEPDEQTRVTVAAGADVDLVPDDAKALVAEYLLPEDEGRLCGEDIAMLLLSQPLDAEPMSVATDVPVDAKAFTAVGYGLFDGDWGQQRQRTDARLLCDGADCADARIAPNELLATAGACEGDSGGPALDSDGQQFALLSRSNADCSESAYLVLSDYVGWIQSGVRYAAQQGNYELPRWLTASTPGSGEPATPSNGEDRDLRVRGGCATSPAPGAAGALPILLCVALTIFRRRYRRE